MTPERWRILQELFQRAIQHPEQRSDWIAELRARDAELAKELAALIEAYDRSTVAMEQSAGPLATGPPRLFFDGQLILGRFEIVRFLGRGGMGEVYEANDREMGRIALKTVRRDISADEGVLSRLRQEVQIARQIASPYVCRVYEFFPIPAHEAYQEIACFTMEFLDGCTLSHHIKDVGTMPWPQIKQLAENVCEGLHAIHQAGFIHRDLKTSNVMVVERNGRTEAVVMDFGLVRKALAFTAAASDASVTAIAGTPQYMAPEQFQGGQVSPATDLYAMGIILYEMIAGRNPFDAATPLAAAAQRARHVEPVSALRSDIPRHMSGVIARCLEYDPGCRYQSARDLAHAIARFRFYMGELPKRAVTKHPWAFALFSIALLAMFTALPFLVRKPTPPSADALHWYEKGIAALEEGSYFSATTAFQAAIKYDPAFLLAHARLAEAWAELGFSGRADHEMLLASATEAGRGLTKLERDYLKAIRAYVIGDFQSAARQYKSILLELPANQKAIGYLSIGRAQEMAGDIAAARQSYSFAAQLPPESPAPLLHRAILEQREGQTQTANIDFSKAEWLYEQAQNYEGQAEINYQRGYLASTSGQLAEATKLIQQSLHTAQEIGSVPLEIRALTRLAVIAYGAGNDDDAIRLAGEAIEIAHNKGVDYWAIDARARLGNAYRDRGQPGDFERADAQLRQALDLAQQNGNPRLVALANWSLASLRDQQGKPEETIRYATAALNYYRAAHFENETLHCLNMINRAHFNESEYSDALRGALEALDLARKTNNPEAIYPSEELVGFAYLKLERYPDALEHFEAALDASRRAGQQVEYGLVHCADALWRIGRYDDAETMLNAIPASALRTPELAFAKMKVLATIGLSQKRYKDALKFADRALVSAKDLSPAHAIEAQMLLIEAGALLDSTRAEKQTFNQLRDATAKLNDPDLTAKFYYLSAVMLMNNGQLTQATSSAQSALSLASSAGQLESEWRTLFCLALISSKSGRETEAREYARKSLDIFTELEHNWGPKFYQDYLSRPDIRDSRMKLLGLAKG